MTAEPKFLRRLGATREHSTGWCTQCPDTHASSGYAVLISLDERAGRYRFTCAEAVNGDLCGNERDLVRMLGLEEADLHIAGLLSIPASQITMRSIEWLEKPLWQSSAFQLLAGVKGAARAPISRALAARDQPRPPTSCSSRPKTPRRSTSPPARRGRRKPRPLPHRPEAHPSSPTTSTNYASSRTTSAASGCFVIDPVANHIGDRNSSSDGEVRDAIAPLNGLANDLECLLIGVRHPGKDRSRGAVLSVLGSTAWVDTPRAVVMIAKDDQDESLRHIQVVAGNRSLNGSAQAFRIEAVDVEGLTEPITRAVELGASTKDVEDLLAIQAGRLEVRPHRPAN